MALSGGGYFGTEPVYAVKFAVGNKVSGFFRSQPLQGLWAEFVDEQQWKQWRRQWVAWQTQ